MELRQKINDIIISYCEGFYHLEFTEDDLPSMLNEIEEAINYNRCCKSDSELLVCDSCEIKFKKEDGIVWCGECYDINTK